MKRHNYKYLIIDARSYKYLGIQFDERYGNRTKGIIDERLKEIEESGLFTPAFSNQGALILSTS